MLTADTRSGWQFIGFLVWLFLSYAGRTIRVVCDNARFHYVRAVHGMPESRRRRIEDGGWPPNVLDLNLFARGRGHLYWTI